MLHRLEQIQHELDGNAREAVTGRNAPVQCVKCGKTVRLRDATQWAFGAICKACASS